MSEIITRPIGSHFNCNGVELEVVENFYGPDGYCGRLTEPCYFDEVCYKSESEHLCRGCCSNYTRTDGKDVYFRRVTP